MRVWPLFRPFQRPSGTIADQLYGAVVAQARREKFYADLGVSDTPDGRLAMVNVHMILILQRLTGDQRIPLRAEQAAVASPDQETRLAQALLEVFVSDLDSSLRELGVGDMGVPKRVKRAVAGLYDLSRRYQAARASDDKEMAANLLVETVPGLDAAGETSGAMLARYLIALEAHLAETDLSQLHNGDVKFQAVAVTGM